MPTLRLLHATPLVLLCLLPAFLGAQPTVSLAPTARGVLQLEPFKVSGAGLGHGESAGTEPTEVYGEQDLEESGVFDLAEFFAQLPESPAGTEQLVLIDGQPTYLDISKLPPEMIASIEVSNHGALPQYGAFANGRVINIRLKTNYRGEHLNVATGGSFVGDGLNGRLAFSGAVKRGSLRLIYSVGYRRQEALLASDRTFSREQDHTARGGRDLRLLWGEAAVVRAVTGNLAGVLDVNGQPAAVALAPEGQDGRGLAPGDFLPAQVFAPATVATAAGQRRFNTADYVTLIAPSEERTATFELSRPFGQRLEASLSGAVNWRGGERTLAPPVSAASADTLVPAAYNPFGQDVQVGLVHTGFGPVRQDDRNLSAQLGLNLNGRWADTWRWSAQLGGRWSRSSQTVTDLDRDRFAAALATPDVTQRFNPFGDDPRNAALYPGLTVVRASETESAGARLDLSAHGEVFTLPGGAARLMLRGNYNDQARTRSYENPANPATLDSRRRDNDQGVNTNLTLPLVGQANAKPWARRIEANLSGGYSTRSGSPGGTVNGRLGLMWSPHRAFSLRGNYTATRRAPSRFVADASPLAGETLLDPRRSPATTPEVLVVERDFDGAVRARSEQWVLGTTIEPPFLPGFGLTVTYDRRQQDDLTSARFRAQDLITNELTFPGRVVRATPSEDDQRLGQPGRIVSVDTTPSDQAAQQSSGLAWSLRYRRRSEPLGQFTFTTSVRHALEQRYEVVPGVPFVFESENDLNPPDWTLQSRLAWSRKGWRVSTDFRFVDAVQSGTIMQPATKRLGVQLGYRFAKPVLGRWGRGLQVSLQLSDLLQGTPPFADTLNGYRTGSPLGRTWSLTMRLPLQLAAAGRERGGEDDEG